MSHLTHRKAGDVPIPDPIGSNYWTLAQPDPAYRVHYSYYWWGGIRYIQATVHQCTWRGDWRLFWAIRTTAKAAYHAAHHAIRAFERHGSTTYTNYPPRVSRS